MPPPGEHSLSVDMASATAVVEDVFYKQGIAVENAEVGSKAAEVWMAPLPDPAVRRGHRAAAIVGTLGVLALLSLIVWKSRLLSGDSADRGTSGGAPAAVVPVQSAP